MARPIKQGLDYFPFDVDFFADEKLHAISWEFGIKGEITTVKLLCAVYRNGYYIEWSEMLKFKLLSELPGVSPDLLDQIIKRLVKWDFFDKGLFDSASILTSKGIQRRYRAISTKTRRRNALSKYCLLDSPAPPPEKETPQSPPPEAPKAAPQPAPPAAAAPAPVVRSKRMPVPLDDSVAMLLADTVWNESVCMRYNLTPEQFRQKVANFRLHCLSREKHEHEDVTDAKKHFCNLLSQGKLNDVHSSNTDAPTDYTYSGGFGSKDT